MKLQRLLNASSAELGFGIVAALALSLLLANASDYAGYPPLWAEAGVISFLIFCALGIVSLQWQFLFFVAVAPVLAMLEKGQAPFQWNEVVRLLMVFTLIVEALWTGRLWPVIEKRLYAQAAILFIVFTALLSLFYAQDPEIGLTVWLRHSLYVVLLPLAPCFLDGKSIRRGLIPLVLLPAFAAVSYGWLKAAKDIAMGKRMYGYGGTYRVTSFLPSVNSFAVYVVSITVFTLGLVLVTRRLRGVTKISLATAIAGFCVPMIFLTFSRRALVVLALSMVASVILIPGRRTRLVGFIALVLAVVAGIAFLPTEVLFNPRILSAVTNPLQDRRVEEWGTMKSVIGSTFGTLLLGIGPGTGSMFVKQVIGQTLGPVMDNYYVTLAADYGLIGVAMYCMVVVSSIVFAWRRKASAGSRAVLTGSLLAVMVIFAGGAFGNTNITLPNSINLWLFLAMGVTSAASVQDSDSKQWQSSVRRGVSAPATRALNDYSARGE